VAYHNNARAFKDLAEFVDQLFFLCSIHSFTPNLGITPRLSSAKANFGPDSRVLTGPPKITTNQKRFEKIRFFPSQVGIMKFASVTLQLNLQISPTISDETPSSPESSSKLSSASVCGYVVIVKGFSGLHPKNQPP
jgi:hypothetical protein